MDKVTKMVWIAVDSNLVFSEYETIAEALSSAPFVIAQEKEGLWENGPYENYAYGIEFYNKDGIKIDGILLNDWRISNLQITSQGFRDNYSKSKIHFTVTDPWGTSEIRNFGYKRNGLISSLIFLKAASQYQSWTEFRQADPAEREKTEVQLLKEEIQRLLTENMALMEKLDTIQKIATVK